MKDKEPKATFRGDMTGGMTAAVVALPESMAYGVIVFAPLGPAYASVGLMAGLVALCFSNIGGAAARGVGIMQSGPFSLSSLMLASALTLLLAKLGYAPGDKALAASAVSLLFLVVFLAGVIQVLFGALKLGDLTKYIPHPVVAGLLNGTAILIFLGQLRPMLGLPDDAALTDFFLIGSKIQFPTLCVGIATVLFIWHGPKLTKKIPPLFLGLIAGTALYYILSFLNFDEALGPVVGKISFEVPKPKYVLEFGKLLATRESFQGVLDAAPLALSLAIVVSLQSLIASVSADSLTRERSNTNKELIGQGLGNMLSAAFGGIANAGSQSRTMANFNYGGRSGFSKLVAGGFALLVLLVLSPLVAIIPKVVLSAVLVVLAIHAFNAWSLRLLVGLLSKAGRRKDIVADLVIVVVVTAILVVIGIFEAVGAGIFISLGFFVYRMGREIIRRDYSAEHVRSYVHRSQKEFEVLEREGEKIRILELEGALFFGTTDKLANSVEAIMEEADYILLDMKRVSDLDSTGADILAQIAERCSKYKKKLVVSSLDPEEPHWDFLKSSGALDAMGDDIGGVETDFESIDDALAWAEDRLLDRRLGTDRYGEEIALGDMDILNKFSKEELESFGQYLEKSVHPTGERIIRQGEEADRLFFIAQGRVHVTIDLPRPGGEKKISTLCPRNVCGEMAVIDGLRRSANVAAEGQLTIYCLRKEVLVRLNAERPDLGYKLLTGLGRELSKRIRISNRIATELAR